MKLGVMADSHENMPMIRRAVEVFNDAGVDLVCHCGDVISPITSREFKDLDAPFVGVFGNNDGDRLFLKKKFRDIGSFHEEPYEFEVDGKTVCLMHRPLHVDALVAEGRLDYVFYGHTHNIDVRDTGRPVVVNPGEAGGWISGRCTVAVVDLATKGVEIVTLEAP